MPLSARARIEIYLPDKPVRKYLNLFKELTEELAYSFEACSVVGDVQGYFRSKLGQLILDRVNIVYSDTFFTFKDHFEILEDYADSLRSYVFEALQEEAVLIVVYEVHHSS